MSKAIYYKTPEEIELIRESCLIVAKALSRVAELIRPGISGLDIDAAAEEVIRDLGAVPGFKGYGGFPNTLCISPNAVVVHGIPNNIEFQDGDIVSVDCGSLKNGFYGDCAFTFALGEVKDEVLNLLRVTEKSLYLGIEAARIGNRIGDIGFAVQDFAEGQNGFSVVREMVGHGVGRSLHEAPEVPNFGRRGKGVKIQEGLVIAIEPMINLGTKTILQANDGWTIYTKDLKPSAHFEHTIAITSEGPEILSDHALLKDALKKNDNIMIF